MDTSRRKVPVGKSVKSTATSSKKILVKQGARAASKVASTVSKNPGKKHSGKSEVKRKNTSTTLTIIESNENQKIMYCAACGGENIFIFSHESWYCDQCGRDKHATAQYLKSQGHSQVVICERGPKDDAIDFIKILRNWVLFFIIVLTIYFLVDYGFDASAKMAKDFLRDMLALLMKILVSALLILILMPILIKNFWK